MPQIMSASWFANLPAGTSPVGISRGIPRGKAGYHRLRDLEPGSWFKSVSPDQYLTRYWQILDGLDPNAIRDQLLAYAQTTRNETTKAIASMLGGRFSERG